MRIKKKSGFTLIELLVVIAILGILAAIGLRSFRSSQIKGRDAQRKHDLGQLQRALEAYYNDKGLYPLPGELPGPGIEWQDLDTGTLYIKSMPADPSGQSYLYESTAGVNYKIFAYLENQKDRDIEDCVVTMGKDCSAPGPCNYGVSSANVKVCE